MPQATLKLIVETILTDLSAQGLVPSSAGAAIPEVADTDGFWCKIADIEDGIIDLWLDRYRSDQGPELYYGVWSSKRRKIEEIRSRFCAEDDYVVLTEEDEIQTKRGVRGKPAVALDRSMANRTLGRFLSHTSRSQHNWFGRYAVGDPSSDGVREAAIFFEDVLSHDRRPMIDGLKVVEVVSRYERDPALRAAALRFHGTSCCVCGFNFEKAYGPALGRGFIHVHHIVPLASLAGPRLVDPRTDLIPVCPNCHAMLHRHNPPIHPDDLRKELNK